MNKMASILSEPPNKEYKENESSQDIYEVKLDSNECHIGQWTAEMSEFLE